LVKFEYVERNTSTDTFRGEVKLTMFILANKPVITNFSASNRQLITNDFLIDGERQMTIKLNARDQLRSNQRPHNYKSDALYVEPTRRILLNIPLF
jgi:hypothetical protein